MSDAITWVVLTQGTRPTEVAEAIASLRRGGASAIVVVLNGADDGAADQIPDGVGIVESAENLGVPGGRDLGAGGVTTELIGFLDDDAVLLTDDADDRIAEMFRLRPELGAISLRIVDERGEVARRHVPRAGESSATEAGPAATFLGGASVIRRAAYVEAGGYWPDLFYAHEELDLSWRLHDAGYEVRYAPDIVVEHPKTPISRHADGWRLTGRNRVMVARRNLPWPVAAIHVTAWLALGAARAPGIACKRSYVRGWWSGWRQAVPRSAIGWSTIRRLARAGRPPII